MIINPERFCALPGAARGLCWLLFTLALAGLGWFFLLRPLDQQTRIEEARMVRLHQRLVTCWHAVLLLKPPVDDLVSDPPPVPFSPLNVQAADTRFVSWQPDARGGTLVLESAWQPIPGIFTRLAQQNMAVTAFALEPTAGRLHVTLQLEAHDER